MMARLVGVLGLVALGLVPVVARAGAEMARCDLETYLRGGATACSDEFQRGG